LLDGIVIGRGHHNLDFDDMAILNEIASHARSPSALGGSARNLSWRGQALSLGRRQPGLGPALTTAYAQLAAVASAIRTPQGLTFRLAVWFRSERAAASEQLGSGSGRSGRGGV
jgi:hypothetical protein